MTTKGFYKLSRFVWLLPLLAGFGCGGGITEVGPGIGILSYPTPVSPWFQKKQEDQFWFHERYARAPILGPLSPDGPHIALDEPSDDQVMRVLEKARPVQGGIPLMHERSRNNVRIVKEKITDQIDPPRFYPGIGPAQLHRSHWKCMVYFTEYTRPGWPIPHTLEDREAMEVVYIDMDHLHMVGNVDTGPSNEY